MLLLKSPYIFFLLFVQFLTILSYIAPKMYLGHFIGYVFLWELMGLLWLDRMTKWIQRS